MHLAEKWKIISIVGLMSLTTAFCRINTLGADADNGTLDLSDFNEIWGRSTYVPKLKGLKVSIAVFRIN